MADVREMTRDDIKKEQAGLAAQSAKPSLLEELTAYKRRTAEKLDAVNDLIEYLKKNPDSEEFVRKMKLL